MAILTQNKEIDLSSGAAFSIELNDLIGTYYLYGTAGSAIAITPSGTPKEGMSLIFKFQGTADLDGNVLTLFGEAIKYVDTTEWIATVVYHKAGWKVNTMPDFEESDIVKTSHIEDASITAPKFASTLSLGSTTITNVDIDSGSIDGTGIGANSASGAEFTSCLIDTVTIDGGTIDDVTIGVSTPATEIHVDNISIDGNTISSSDTNGDINLAPDGTGGVIVDKSLSVDNVKIDGNTISSEDTNGDINITPNGTGVIVVGASKLEINGVTLTSDADDLNKFAGLGTLTAADMGLIAGAAGVGVTATDIRAIADINNALEADANSVTIKTGKYLDVTGYIKEDITVIASTPTTLTVDDTYAIVGNTAGNYTVNLPAPGSCTGKMMALKSVGTWRTIVTTVAGANVFKDYIGGAALATLNMHPSQSITVVSDGNHWYTINRTGGHFEYNSGISGQKHVKILQSAELTALLDSTLNEAMIFNPNDIILSVRFMTGTVCGGLCKVDVGVDGVIYPTGFDIDAFITQADANAAGYYNSDDVALTYTGALLKEGLFTAVNPGYLTISSSTDMSGSAFSGSLIVEYIPA